MSYASSDLKARPSTQPIPTGITKNRTNNARHGRDVAVDPLNQLAGRVASMELVVESEYVPRDSHPESIRGVPRCDRRAANHDDLDNLAHNHDREEQHCQVAQLCDCRIVGCPIDYSPHDKRSSKQQRRSDCDHTSERQPSPAVRPE